MTTAKHNHRSERPTQGPSAELVLSDLVMPNMGGQALFHALRRRGLPLPVVMLSGHPMETELEHLRAQGLAGWLRKPPDMARLSHMLARALATHRNAP